MKLVSKCALGCFLLVVNSCATYVPMNSAPIVFNFPIVITSDPPGAKVYSIPRGLSSDRNLRVQSYAYEQFGPGKKLIGITPFAYTNTVVIRSKSNGTQSEMWEFSTVEWSGANSLNILTISTAMRDKFVYSDFYRTMTYGYTVELDGFETEVHEYDLAAGVISPIELYDRASMRPFVMNHVLKKKAN